MASKPNNTIRLLVAIGIILVAGAGLYFYYTRKVDNLSAEQDKAISKTATMPENIKHLIGKATFDDDNHSFSDFIEAQPANNPVRFKHYLVFTDEIWGSPTVTTAAIYHPSLNKALGLETTNNNTSPDGIILEHMGLKEIGDYVDDAGRKTQKASQLYATLTYVNLNDTTVLHRDTVWGPLPSETITSYRGSPVGGFVKEEDEVKVIRTTLQLP